MYSTGLGLDDLDVSFTLEAAFIIGVLVEVLLYGIYTCLFFESLYILLKGGSLASNAAAKIFFSTAILMYCIATAHIGINLYRTLRGYVWLKNNVDFDAYFADPTRWDNVASNVLFSLMAWIGDSLAIYRCLIVWNYNYYVIAIPSLIVLANISVATVVFCWADKISTIPLGPRLHFSTALYPLAFAQNTLTTGFIAFRIYRQHRASNASGAHDAGSPLTLLDVVRIFVESAILYPAELLMLIVLFAMEHNAQYIVQAAATPSIGIVFNLIAVRVHLRRSEASEIDAMDEAIPDWLKISTISQIGVDMQTESTSSTKQEHSPSMVLRDRLAETP